MLCIYNFVSVLHHKIRFNEKCLSTENRQRTSVLHAIKQKMYIAKYENIIFF